MIVDPTAIPERDAYRLMISAFVPRPIAFVSSRSRSGIDNCAPFSYSMGVSSVPMVLAVSVGEREGRPKDTARNILDTREFVVNIVTETIAERMNQASAGLCGEHQRIRRGRPHAGFPPTSCAFPESRNPPSTSSAD